MNYIPFHGFDLPEQAINKVFIREGKSEAEAELVIQDMIGGVYVLNKGYACDLISYKKALIELLGWTKVEVPEPPFVETHEITLYVGDGHKGTYTQPEGFTELLWDSTNDDVAIVEQDGSIMATGKGKCQIDAYFQKPYKVSVSRYYVTVLPAKPAIKQENLFMFANNDKHVTLPIHADFSGEGWTSSDTAIATVTKDGNIHTIKVGKCDITGHYTDPYNADCMKYKLEVTPPVPTPKKENITFKQNTTYQGLIPADANYKGTKWVSSNTNIVVVNQNGLMTGVNKGQCTVTGKYTTPFETDGIVYTANITDPPVTTLTVEPTTLSLTTGTTREITITTNATSSRITMDSDNAAVATADVSKKTITAVGVGSCKVIVTAQIEGGDKKRVEVTVNVTAPAEG